MKKPLLIFLLMFGITIFMSACGKNSVSNGKGIVSEPESKEAPIDSQPLGDIQRGSYKSDNLSEKYRTGQIIAAGSDGENFYVYSSGIDADKKAVRRIISFDSSGNVLVQSDLNLAREDERPLKLVCTTGKHIYMLTAEELISSLEYRLYRLNSENLEFQEEIPLNFDTPSLQISDLFITEKCMLFVLDYGKYIKLDLNGDVISEGKLPSANSALFSSGNRIYAFTPGNPGTLSELDVSADKFNTCMELPAKQVFYADDDIVYAADNTDLYAYNKETAESISILNFISCGIKYPKFLFILDNGDGIVMSDGLSLFLVWKEAGSTIDYAELTLGTCQSAALESMALKFNNANPNVKLRIKDYSDYQNPDQIIAAELTAGDAPDIIDFNSFSGEIINPDVFLDLNAFFESENYTETVSRNLLETDGKLITFVPTFFVNVIFYPADMAEKCSAENIIEFKDSIGDLNLEFAGSLSRDEFLSMAFSTRSTSDLSREEISAVLEIAEGLPEAAAKANAVLNLHSGAQNFEFCALGGPAPLRYYSFVFDREIESMGLPLSGKNSGMLIPCKCFGICKASQHTESALQFFRYLMSWDYYEAYGGNEFSLNADCLSRYRREEEKIINDSGLIMHFNLNGRNTEFKIEDTKDFDIIENILRNIGSVYCPYSTLYNMCSETSERYFMGASSLEACTDTIYSKIQIYNAEHR